MHEVPVVGYQSSVTPAQQSPGMRGLPCLGRCDERDPGSCDIERGAMHGIDAVLVLQKVGHHRKRHALYPAVVFEVEQERGPGEGIVPDRQPFPREIEDDKAAVRAYVLGHVVEVVLPHVLRALLIGKQAYASAMYLRLDRVQEPVAQALEQFLGLPRSDGLDDVHSLRAR